MEARAMVRRGGTPRTRPRSPGKVSPSTRRHTRFGGPPTTECGPRLPGAIVPRGGAAHAPDRTLGGTRWPSGERLQLLARQAAGATDLLSAAGRERPTVQPGSIAPQRYGTLCARPHVGGRPRARCAPLLPRPTSQSVAAPPARGRPGCQVGADRRTRGAAARTREESPHWAVA